MKSILSLLISTIVLYSCQSNDQNRYYTGNFESVFKIAQNEKKPIWMILGGGKHCLSCNQLIEDMEKENIFKRFKNDYLFFRCNVEEPDNIFLKYIFLMEAIPNSYIVSTDGKVNSYISGQITGKDVEKQLVAVKNKQTYYPAHHSQFKSNSQKLLHLQNLLLPICLNLQHSPNDTSKLRKMLPDLKKSIAMEPYFYNLYLASRIHQMLEDTLLSEEYAQKALKTCPDGFQSIIYSYLVTDLQEPFLRDNLYPAPKITFETQQIDINTDSPEQFVFKFQNTGTKPLIVKYVSSSCGCAKPQWDKKPILPGERGSISIVYKPEKDKSVTKTFLVQSNAINKIERLTLKGNK